MKRKVHPSRPFTQRQISSTSRHQLKQLKQSGNTSIHEETEINLSNFKLKFFVSRLAKKIKYLAPPFIKPECVLQQWEQELKNEEKKQVYKAPDLQRKQTLSEQLTNRYQLFNIFCVLQGIILIIFFWMVTVSIVFQVHILQTVSLMVILVASIEIFTKIKIVWNEHEGEKTYEIYCKEDFIEPVIIALAACFMLLRGFVQNNYFQCFMIAFQFVALIVSWDKIGKCLYFLKIYAEQNKKRRELRIIELFGFTIMMAHIFALIMYAMSYINVNQTTWITKAGLESSTWLELYIYAFYWANTTMVTVGYGDLTPSNYAEVIVITFIQIVGTAIFGYMINVIGITVNQINKKNQQFEQYEGMIFKLKNHYHLSRQLCYRMKNDIKKKDTEMKESPLKNSEQRQFLEYIDGNLKDQFVLETNMRVIKKSIFFLTHFTVNFQNQIALKLIRCIYKPQETIHFEVNGEKQLVIIDSGKVNIFFTKYHHNQELIKKAREIKPQEGKPTLNVYGYSSVILNKKMNLKAITEQTTTAYILKREDILESMSKSMLDFQSFNELRQKMQQCVNMQEIQAPALKQYQKHYIPNPYLVVKKLKSLFQKRQKTLRGQRRGKRMLVTLKHYKNKTMLYIPEPEKQDNQYFDIEGIIGLPQKSDKGKKNDNLCNKTCLPLDQAKNFQNFLKSYNLRVVANEYENACLKRTYLHRYKSSKLIKTTKKAIINEI